MKTKSLLKLIIVATLCLAVLFVFSACKDKEIYAGSDDFQSYPEYWNDFNNDDSGDLIVPNGSGNTTSSEITDEDPNANFTPEDEESEDGITSSKPDADTDTDNDGTPDDTDTDDDNDGITDDKDDDDNGNGTPDDEEKPDYGNQGPIVFF